jgi:hypothetical protein
MNALFRKSIENPQAIEQSSAGAGELLRPSAHDSLWLEAKPVNDNESVMV